MSTKKRKKTGYWYNDYKLIYVIKNESAKKYLEPLRSSMNDKTASYDVSLRDARRTIDVIFEISDAVNRTRNLRELYQAIHRSLGKILNVDNFFIAIHHPEKDSISFPYYIDEKDECPSEIYKFSRTASFAGQIIQAAQPMFFYKEDLFNLSRKVQRGIIGTPSEVMMGVPLRIKNKITGVLAVQSYRSRYIYKKEDLAILNLVGQHIALAIERKESDEAYRHQRKVLEKILETSPVGIALIENRVFKWVNPEMVSLFGYESKDAFKEADLEMIYESRESYLEADKKIYSGFSNTRKTEMESILMKKDGTSFPAHIQMSSPDPSNPMAWIIATFTNISARKQADAEKIKNEKLQGVLEMAGAVCHELNQPLQALLGYSELLIMDQPEDSQNTQDMEAIRNQVERISRITQRLSGITRYKTVDYPGNKKIVDIWGASDN